jgi:LPS-assembly protein
LRVRFAWWTALPLLLLVPAAANAQPVPATPADPPQQDLVSFNADQVSYDTENEVITASGAVRMSREGNYVAADRIVWDRRTGEVRAEGNVVVLNPEGDKLVGERVVLTEALRDGSIDNLLVVLESGGRIAAGRSRTPSTRRAR